MLGKLLCLIGAHGKKYQYKIQKSDGKSYHITTCHRCWKEIEKAVK